LWQKARRRIRQAGVPLRPAATAAEVARTVGGTAAADLAAAYTAARWGGAPLSAVDARRLLRDLAHQLDARA
jgi:uncharacterized protein DUF4129